MRLIPPNPSPSPQRHTRRTYFIPSVGEGAEGVMEGMVLSHIIFSKRQCSQVVQ